MITITCVQVWTSVPKSLGFQEAEALLGGTRSRWAGTQGTWVCLLEGRALPLWDCLIQEGCPTPMGAQGLAGSRNQEAPPDGPGPLLRSTGKLLFSLSVQAAAKGLRRTEHGLRKETCLA